jgi:hypothetical protein
MASRKGSALDYPVGGAGPLFEIYTWNAGNPYKELIEDLPVAQVLMFALSDETTELTVGTKLTIRVPFECTLKAVRASVNGASSSGDVIVDINESLGSGGASILSTKLQIDQDTESSLASVSPVQISDPDLADDAELTFDVDSAGTGATGLKVYLYVSPTKSILPTAS